MGQGRWAPAGRHTHLLHGDGEFAALVQQFADGVGRVAVTLGQFGHISLDASDHTLHLHLMHLEEEPEPTREVGPNTTSDP